MMVDRVLDRFVPVALDELLRRAALQQRVDRKYVVDREALAELLRRLPERFTVLEIDGIRLFSYRTMYFDSPSLLTYRAHVQGRRRRFKCRSRLYVDSDLHMIEVKLKGLRGETVKERLEAPAETHGIWDAAAHAFLAEQLRRHYGLAVETELEPTVQMAYSRVTLADVEAGERLTIDVGLRYDTGDSSFVLAPGTAIVESKSALGHASADRLLRELEIRPVSCSKYCVGIALTRPDAHANDFLRLARRHFRPGAPTHTSLPCAAAPGAQGDPR